MTSDLGELPGRDEAGAEKLQGRDAQPGTAVDMAMELHRSADSVPNDLGDGARPTAEPLASTGLLSFYDRLRERVLHTVEHHGGKLGPAAVEALLLVPDLFILLVRLALDREVPKGARALIGGALAYFLLPIDLFPEGMIGPAGLLEDLVLAAAVLSQALGGELEPYARKHWSGDKELREVLHDVAQSSHVLLGGDLHHRLENVLEKRGIKIKH